jgi:hypothetical protein
LDGTVECYVKAVEEHLRKVVLAHQNDWDERLPLFLMATSMVFGWEIREPSNLLFGAAPDKEQSTNDHMTDPSQGLHDIHQDDHQHSEGSQ